MKSVFKSLPLTMRQKGSYSTTKISSVLLDEVKETLEGFDYGSVEIYVVNNEVTQITRRHIKKTNHHLTKKGK